MEFNLAEKLAIVKAIDQVILADGHIEEEEILYLNQVMNVLEIDLSFVQEARKFNTIQARVILQKMSNHKKSLLLIMLREMANADDNIDRKEIQLINSIFSNSGVAIENLEVNKLNFDVADIYFESSDNIEYKNGNPTAKTSEVSKIAIKVETNNEGIEGYLVTTYNLDDNTPIWGSNIEMSSKQMKVIESSDDKTILRGFGEDLSALGDEEGNYSNYGISIIHPKNEIERINLHFHHQNIDIEYIK